MYTIRVESQLHLLRIELSGRVMTAEALRAIDQAAMLAEAGGLKDVLCDLRDIRRGPGDLAVVGAALALRSQPGLRIALAAEPSQIPLAQRLMRFSGVRRTLRLFDSVASAEAWLGAHDAAPRQMANTELRHAEAMLPAAAADARHEEIAALAG